MKGQLRMQLELPPPRRPFVADSDTSEDAAQSMEPHAGTLLQSVLDHIRNAGWLGSTDDEGERALDMRHTTYSARRRDLVLRDLVIDSGRRRMTSGGRAATVWIVKENNES